MIPQIFKQEDLPLQELETLGLAKDGRLTLSRDDQRALMAGRRTGMIRLECLSAEGFTIPEIDAKISLKPNAYGQVELRIHPIYREAACPGYLTDLEAEELQIGQVANIWKLVKDSRGANREVLIEFDQETNEFIVTDTEQINVPDRVNSEYLSFEQKERMRNGKEVQLSDGTKFQFSGTDRQGIRSNRLALIASVLVDGGVSYVLYKGLHAMFGDKIEERERMQMSLGYKQAVQEMHHRQGVSAPVSEYPSTALHQPQRSRSQASR